MWFLTKLKYRISYHLLYVYLYLIFLRGDIGSGGGSGDGRVRGGGGGSRAHDVAVADVEPASSRRQLLRVR